MPVNKAVATLQHAFIPNKFNHAGYLAVAKTRAKALHAFSLVVSIPRPQLFIGDQSCFELCDMMINEGATKVLIVTDSVLNQLGIPDKITDYLQQK
ncbi:hypothetical protein STRSA0001_0994, partial [Streptococcus salivarius SK126]